jgi:transglutaminase-like putative cysteine protease
MTAGAAIQSRPSVGDGLQALLRGPAEGWLSLIAAVVMVDVLALSLVNAGWTGNVGNSSFLPWLALVSTLLGAAGAKVGWGRWRTHLVGALLGGLIIPLVVGGVLLPSEPGWDPAGLARRMVESFTVVRNVWTDFVVLNLPTTTEYGYYHLVFGAMIWAAGMLAGFSVLAHRRPLDLVVTIGLVLLANIALTANDQLFLLEIYSAAGLVLLIRTHVFEEQVTWLRRKIGDPTAVAQLYLGRGGMFVVTAVLGAILLTAVASSAPLQGLFADLPARLQAISRELQRFAPPGGDFQGLGFVTFGDNAVTTGQWSPSTRTAFRVQLNRNETELFKWRAGVYTDYTKFGWQWGPTQRTDTPARATVLGDAVNGDMPSAVGRRELDFRIVADAYVTQTIVSPNTIASVDRETNVISIGADGWFTSVEARDVASSYSVAALVPDYSDQETGITEPNLRTASTDYPDEIRDLYITNLPDGAIGPRAAALLEAIKARVVAPEYAAPDNPYDLARTMETYLRSPSNFTYDPDVRAERNASCGGDVSTVECFAIIRRGYCDYYASTMAVLLRASGVPARVAYGFLPGTRGTDGTEVVGSWLAHYWVEVYFPGYGWVEFDPTGGSQGRPTAIPTGVPPAATARPTARPSVTAGPPRTPGPTTTPGGGVTSTGTGIGPFIAIGAILLVGLALLVYAIARRAPRKPMHPDQAWGSLGRLAARIGLGPRASQTVYEYAGALGDAVPDARLELTTIARAKVEVAYGRRDLGNDRLRRIAEAYQRLRFALLGVVVRRTLHLRRPGRRR